MLTCVYNTIAFILCQSLFLRKIINNNTFHSILIGFSHLRKFICQNIWFFFLIHSLVRTFCLAKCDLWLVTSHRISFRFTGQNFQLRWKPHFVCPIYLSVHCQNILPCKMWLALQVIGFIFPIHCQNKLTALIYGL